MTTPMTTNQKQLAEEHMDLVPRMVAVLTKRFPLCNDQWQELCQVGYLALCRAAVSCKEGYSFSPYAHAAICNAIYDFWRRDIREKKHLCSLLEDQPEPSSVEPGWYSPEEQTLPESFLHSLKATEAGAYLETLKATQCSTIQKGIEAICYQLEGYSSKELSTHYRVPANHIRAWQSKARRFLAQDATLCALLSC